MSVIRIAMVEDDARLRCAISEVFSKEKDFECVGVFANGQTAIDEVPRLKPDVLIMDVNLPDISGVECVAQLAPQLPGTQIIMLTVFQDTDTIFNALGAGAHGYLVKPVMPAKLLEAVREIRAGGVPMSRTIARKVIDFFQQPPPRQHDIAPVEDVVLGKREQQVLDLLVQGYSYKEIGNELDIKVSTIGTHMQRIYSKLHVRSRREIIERYKR
ncbi:MAG: response regulator transcription factor [Kiritimatiellae bacterium]|nr:response regulator transcription factor [Kiritimatiellia bacterium]